MPESKSGCYTYKMMWGAKHDKAYAFHIGLFFCIDYNTINLFISEEDKEKMPWYKKLKYYEYYLFFCIGTHDFTIGRIVKTYDELDERWL